jgi:16S rRNA (guanine(527)-N(7))-methyltransferase GidB
MSETDRKTVDATQPDPLDGDPRLPAYFGAAWPKVERFAQLLRSEGEVRGLIGPREQSRLWERHILNSAAVVPYLPATGRIVDVGTGAGLPGVVVAAMLREAEVVLMEPMERRTQWLEEVVDALELGNARVLRGRAEEFDGAIEADAVTARAVAAMDKLARWCLPLLRDGGALVALKGASAPAELEKAKYVLRKLGGDAGEVLEARTIDGVDSTTVVRVVRKTVR